MPRAVLTVHIPDRVWMGQLTRRHPDAEFRILTAFPDGDHGTAMAEVTVDRPGEVLQDMDDCEEVVDLELLGRPGPEALVQFETSEPLLLVPVRKSGALLDLPFEVQDGRASWEVTATRDRLSTLGDQLQALGISFEVESVTQGVEADRLLTDRQSTLVDTAVEEGYYDTPRDCTLTDLAAEVGVAKSTASETLHRAEGKIVKEFVDEVELTS
jgi:predicted DNA binding protein